jgi:hypothetical protein
MKREVIWIGAVAAVFAASLLGLHAWLIDGLGGLLWGSLFREDTAYAAGYTDRGWRSIRMGMRQADVRASVGDPLQVWTNRDASVGMRWTRSPGDTHYRCRVLQLRDGRVTAKHSAFYVD